MEAIQTNSALAIYEYFYAFERKRYSNLLFQKAKRLKILEAKDLFAIPETEARKIVLQIAYLTEELNTLYGFKLFTDQMENDYLKSTERIFNSLNHQNALLERELQKVSKMNCLLREMYGNTLNSLVFMTDVAIQQTNKLNTINNYGHSRHNFK